jgi:hypothetical protein
MDTTPISGMAIGRSSDFWAFCIPTSRCFPTFSRQCFWTVFVPNYRCGAAPDSHRIPFSPSTISRARHQ